ncbi:MAG: hypothetical protein GY791_00490 [Alphaproteobacteria bacterium]|nr:hypothetical protein [Alphaproteobacteria bacterium]
MSAAPITYRVILLFAAVGYILLAILASGLGVYHEYFRALGIESHPIIFVDMSLFSDVECIRLGNDILFDHPCDPLGRLFNQSPLWLALSVLPVTGALNLYAGAVLGLTFLGVMCWMLRPRNPGQTVFCAAALLSSSVMFAVERANRDLIVILLVVAATALLGHGRWRRIIGYAILILAGLLKFYPFAALVVTVEEKWRGFLVVMVSSIVALAVFVFVSFDDLAIVLGNIPQPMSRDAFAGNEIVNWIVSMSDHYLRAAWRADAPALQGVRWGMVALSATASLVIWHRFDAAGIRLTGSAADRRLFLAGAAMIAFCFLVSQNISYRCALLLLVIPLLLTTAAEKGGDVKTRRLVWLLSAGILLVLWVNAFHFRVDPFFDRDRNPLPWHAVWLIDEINCWAIITVLLALVWQQAAASPLLALLAGTRAAQAFRRVGDLAAGRPLAVPLASFLVVAGAVFGFQTLTAGARTGSAITGPGNSVSISSVYTTSMAPPSNRFSTGRWHS